MNEKVPNALSASKTSPDSSCLSGAALCLQWQGEFDEENDFGLRTGPEHCGMTLGEGRFAVFFPGELYKPSCKTPGCDHVRKAVVKILMK